MLCKFCNQPFEPVTSNQKYCKRPHIRTCPICKCNYIEYHTENLLKPPVACSYNCRKRKSNQTNLQKYGSTEYFSSKQFNQKRCESQHLSRNTIQNKYRASNQDFEQILSASITKDNYIIFRSHAEYPTIDLDISDSIRSKNLVPVVTYPGEDLDRVIGQLELSQNSTIHSNDLNVYKLNTSIVKDFIAKNDYVSSIEGVVLALGLATDDEIYQVMIFGSNRHNKQYKLQLLRICNKSGYTIIGGLDKLSSVASQKFEICRCIAYQNQSKSFMNSRFESIGMKFIRHNPNKSIVRSGQTIYDFGVNVYVFE